MRLLTRKCLAGPKVTVKHQVQAAHLHSIVATLEVAVQACLMPHLNQPLSGRHTPSPHSTPLPESSMPDQHAAQALPFLDSTAMAALLGCAGHLLRLQSKAGPTTAAGDSSSNHGSKAQQAQQAHEDSVRVQPGLHEQSRGGVNDAGDEEVEGPPLPWVVSSLKGQVTWLQDILGMPWQLQASQQPPAVSNMSGSH